MYHLFLILFFLINFTNAKTNFGAWSEWTSYNDLSKKISILKASNTRLHLAIKKDELHEENFQKLIVLLKKAESEGVNYWLWPLLSKEEGYWPNQWNIKTYSNYVLDLLNKLKKHKLKPSGISIDLEPPPEKLEKYLLLIQKFKLFELHSFANSSINESLFEKAKKELRILHLKLKQQKITTHIVTTPFLLDEKNSIRLQKVFGIPLDNLAFDYISFMAYRSEFERLVGEMNSRLVYDYSLQARKVYGNRAGIDLGVVGNIEFPHKLEGYSDPNRLWEDISAAKAAGISSIQVYCLDGIQTEDWIKDVEPIEPTWSFKFYIVHNFLSLLFSQI
jgi:hypothetical protein